MSKFQKWQNILKTVLIIAIVGSIAIGIASRGQEEKQADTVYEKIFKISAFFMVILALILYWILPNTKIAKRFKMNESLFISSHILGMVCGITGLAASFLWQQMVVKTHLFEFMVALFGLVFVYWAMILKARKTVNISDILDEKQIDNVRKAATATLFVVTGIMLVMYFLSYNEVLILEGEIWFLCYFFMTLLVYSGSTLYYFKKE